jgi:hypothetical protein
VAARRGRVLFTTHAMDMLRERGFRREQVESIVEHAEWKMEGEGEIWYALHREEDKILRVVVRGKDAPWTVVTMYYDRRLK